jgi:hypothetical protein
MVSSRRRALVRTADESPTSDGGGGRGGGGAAVVGVAVEAEEVELDRRCGRHVCVVAACREEEDRSRGARRVLHILYSMANVRLRCRGMSELTTHNNSTKRSALNII